MIQLFRRSLKKKLLNSLQVFFFIPNVLNTLKGGNEVEQNSLKSSPKNPCAYSLFYVEDNCEVLDFSPECLESLKKLLSKELLSFVKSL